MIGCALECSRVFCRFVGRSGTVLAVEDVSFSARSGEFICLVGPSGCGKTTLLRMIAGLLAPSSGTIEVRGDEPGQRPRSALVFQEHGVFPWMTVLDNVAFGLEACGVPKRERRERAREFIEQVGLDRFRHSYPAELSLGMRQRVGIARAFVADPDILLMDEPFGSLDAQTKQVLQEDLLKLWAERRKLVVFVTHDIEEAVRLGDRVLVMSARPGRILQDLPVPLHRPRTVAGREEPQIIEMKWHIWRLLEKPVREGLSMRS
jgi:NitT/TauT family transport system ATP-binding protein